MEIEFILKLNRKIFHSKKGVIKQEGNYQRRMILEVLDIFKDELLKIKVSDYQSAKWGKINNNKQFKKHN